jgi:hypothetical protein
MGPAAWRKAVAGSQAWAGSVYGARGQHSAEVVVSGLIGDGHESAEEVWLADASKK